MTARFYSFMSFFILLSVYGFANTGLKNPNHHKREISSNVKKISYSNSRHIFNLTPPPPSIVHSGSLTFCNGDSVILYVIDVPVDSTFQWTLNGTNISGAITDSLVVYATGTYSCIVTSGGVTEPSLNNVVVTVHPKPLAAFTFSPNFGCGETRVSFTDQSTISSGSNINWHWNFGDGITVNQHNPSHTFNPPPGSGTITYTITLIVTSNSGCKDTISHTITIDRGPDATLNGTGATIINGQPYFHVCSTAGQAFTFTNASTTIASNTNYIINWGDGSTDWTDPVFPTPITHPYSVGIHNLTFYVYSGACVDSTVYRVFVGNNPAGGLVSPGGTTICAGSTQAFLISGASNNPPGTQYILNFNDGSAPDTFYHPAPDTVFHTFDSSSCGHSSSTGNVTFPNSYGAYLTITNPCGTTGGSVVPIYVSGKPISNFTITPKDTICVGQTVILTYNGDLGNNVENGVCTPGKPVWKITPQTPGVRFIILSGSLGNDFGTNDASLWLAGTMTITIRFDSVGLYNVKLKTGNSTLCGIDSLTKLICVNPIPTATFDIDKNTGCAPLTVLTTNNSSLANCGQNAFNWTVTYTPTAGCLPNTALYIYINGTDAHSANPQFQFINPGVYTISLLTIAPAASCSSTVVSKIVTVKGKPVVNLNVPASVCANQVFNPTATYSCYIGANTTYAWSFPGGTPSSSNLPNPGPITYSVPGTYTISLDVTNECGTTTVTTSLIVKPNPIPNVPGNIIVCPGVTVGPLGFTSTPSGATFSWVNSNTSIGLAAAGNSNPIPAFTATNATTSPIVANITVTATLAACSSSNLFTITVNPAGQLNQPGNQTVCNGNPTTAITFTTNNSGGTTTYNWTNSNSSIGLLSAGSGNIASFTAVNNGTAPVVATITVTPTFSNGGANCTGPAKIFTITVNPTGQVNQPANIVVCNGQLTTVTYSTVNTVGTTTYSWTNSLTAIGLAASGNGNISFTAVNNGTSPILATIVVTPTFTNNGVNCTGPTKTYTITVNPSAQVNQPTSQVVCNGNPTTAISFTTNNSGGATTYSWVNNNTSIGLAANGAGDIASFTAINNGTVPVIASITVTPSFVNGGSNCTGPTKTFTITVNPSAQVNQPANQVVCNTDMITVNFGTTNTGGTTTYSWTNDNTAIGLTSSGNGNISFTATNATTAPIVANIVITPTFANGGTNCVGPTKTFTITVNPTGQVNQPVNLVVCNGQLTTVSYATVNTGGTTTYSWTNSLPAIGLAATGTGDISFTAVNNGTSPIVGTIVVTPIFTNAGVSCNGPTKSYTITVNPSAQVNQPANQVYCNTNVANINFGTTNTGGTITYAWTNDNIAIGLSALGTGNISFTATNNGTTPLVANIVVNPSFTNAGITCAGSPKSFTITVNPTGQVNQPVDQVVCNGQLTTVTYATLNTVGSTTYAWTNSLPAIGLPANGTGNISFNAINNGTAPIVATIVVTPTFTNAGLSCSGPTKTYTITVNPSAQVNQPTGQVVCNGAATTAIAFTTNNTVGATSYSWTNNNPAIGLLGTGTGNIASFTATNNGTSPIVATIVVTPSFTNAGVTCAGSSKTFTITVNPTGQVTQPADQVVCNGQLTTVTYATINNGGVTTYAWTNSLVAIGLPANGTGNISFNAVNNGTTPIVATIVVTPTFTNAGVSCSGPIKTYTITVNPGAQVNQPTSQVVCNGGPTTAITFTTNNGAGTTSYSWTNTNPGIGLVANGTGDIASFTATNNGTSPVVATIVVTPTFTNGGAGCPGSTKTFTITVNPTAQVIQPANVDVCNGQLATVTYATVNTGGVTTYTWTNSLAAIGLPISGTGNISFNAVNNGTAPIVATIVVTPTFTNAGLSCTGPSMTYTITVNPGAQVNQPTSQVVCNGNPTTAITFTTNNSGGATIYSWTNTNPGIGIAATGTGDIASFIAVNNGTSPIIATIVVTPSFNNGGAGCSGGSKTFTITVNPSAQVTQPTNQVICNGAATTAISFATTNTGGSTLYNWTNTNSSIGLATGGSGDIPSFTAVNNGTSPIIATIVVTPSFTNAGITCAGASKTFTITVNPTGQVNQPADQVVCNGQLTTVTYATLNSVGVTTYAWTNSLPAIGLLANGTGNISFNAVNNGTSPIVATIVVTPTFTNAGISCSGPTKTYTITVNPGAQVNQPTSQVLCNGDATTAISFTTNNTVGATSYSWTNNNPSIGLGGTGTGDIASFTATNNGTAPIVATIVVTPSFLNAGITCTGPSKTFTITVNPTAQVTQPANFDVCNGQLTTVTYATVNTGGTTTYAWTNSLPAIGLAPAGTGNISFNAINNGTSPIVATIVVAPTFTNAGVSCSGPIKTYTITVNPGAQVNQPTSQVVCNGSATTAISFTTNNGGGSTTYSWTNNNPGIGLTATGTGDIASFTATNNGTSPVTATIVVTPTFTNGGAGCPGTPKTFTITVNPSAQVNQPTNQVVCNGGATTTITFTTNNTVGSTSYSWVNNNPGVGLVATGAGDILTFTAINNGNSPVVATIVVSATFTNGGTSCTGPAKSFTITVNPTAQVIQPASLVVCNSQLTTVSYATVNTGGSTTYTWTNSLPAIGLPATGTGNISFNAVNNGTAPIVAIIVVTPTFTNAGVSCVGPTKTYTITINPSAQVNQPSNQAVCNLLSTATVLFGTNNTGGLTTYSWTNSNPGIGLAANGTGDIPTFIPVNNGTSPIVATIVVTPTFANAGTNCPGPSKTFTINVNPDAKSEFTADTTIGCAPFNISQHINVVRYTNANNEAQYQWLSNGVLVGTGLPVPNYSITQPGDTVVITLIAVSKYGCKDDTSSITFYTVQRPVPSFTTNTDTACGPISVLITNTTTPINVIHNSSYFWDFGNGTTSTAVQPGTIIFQPNPTYGDTTYIVKLKVTTVCDTITISKPITVQSKPKALFTPDHTFGCSPFTVVFTNTSLGLNNNYVWDFGDGTTLNTNNNSPVSHTYNTGIRDTFHVVLHASNNCGGDSLTYIVIVSPNTIHLLFGVNGNELSGCAPHVVHFLNNSNGATSFYWNFGDGTPITTSTRNIDTVTHTYFQTGTFNVTLRGTNGCADTSTSLVINVFQKPVPAFVADKYLVCIGDSVHFTNQTDTATSYLWQFGDGATSSLINPRHTYTVPGLYRVVLTAYRVYPSGSVCSDTISRTINVVTGLPGLFDVSDSVGQCAPFTVTFNNRNLPATVANWDFGDGTTGTGNTVTHVYLHTGTFIVRLIVNDPVGCTYTSQRPISILGPDGTLQYTGGFYCNSQQVRLEATASNTDSLFWDFGDGNYLLTTLRIVYHTYSFAGAYVPKVVLRSNAGCQFPIQGLDTVKVDKITAGFTWSQQKFCGVTKVQFTDTSHAYFGLRNLNWDFGDGTTGTGSLIAHNYATTGNYTVRLIIFGNSNCSDTVSHLISVVVNNIPIASILADTTGCTFKPMTFNSFIQSVDPVSMISWTVSNGVVGSGSSLVVNFGQFGTYTVRLVTGTVNGCYDTVYHTVTINPSPTVTTNNDINLCLGNTVQLNANGALQYSWTPIQGLSCTSCSNPIASPTYTTSYVVRGVNSFGCDGYDSVLIQVIQPIQVTVTASDTICIGKSVQLMASGANSYLWTPSLGLNANNIPNPVSTPASTITYRVVGSDAFNCFTDTGFVTIAVGKYPTVELGPDLTLSTGTNYSFIPVIQFGPIRDWLWTPSTNLNCATCPSPIAIIKDEITYRVKVTTNYGCSASDTIHIKVFCESSQVFIPNAFTPNGDGRNDILMVRGTGILAVKSFRIFNRWGEIIFEKNNFPPNNPIYGWDGMVKGQKVAPDVFVYTAEVICDNGTPYVFKGNVTLLK